MQSLFHIAILGNYLTRDPLPFSTHMDAHKGTVGNSRAASVPQIGWQISQELHVELEETKDGECLKKENPQRDI